MNETPIYFGGLKGHLVPDLARVHDKASAEIQKHIADLSDGEAFSVRYIMAKGRLYVEIEPKRVRIG